MRKIIHYCWFGKKNLPLLAKKCIISWKKYLPDYEIMEWNESNFDVNMTEFSKNAYKEKKYAFVSDVARIYALKKFGGIYFDTDMMLTKNIDALLENNFFAGWESPHNVAVGVLYAKKSENEIINSLWKKYNEIDFDINNMWNVSIPRILTKELKNNYNLLNDSDTIQILNNKTVIYSRDYFYPISSEKLPDLFTKNTCMIHYYDASWVGNEKPIVKSIKNMFGQKVGSGIVKVLVKGKHVVFYPIKKINNKRQLLLHNKKYYEDFSNEVNELPKIEYLTICRKEWIGTRNATYELFDNCISLPECSDEDTLKRVARVIIDKKIKLLIFSAFDYNWKIIIDEIRKYNSKMIIKVLWHGSNSLHVEDYDYMVFESLFRMMSTKKINSIGFVKLSMYEQYKRLGYNVEMIYNRVELNKKYTKEVNKDKKVRIGLYASGDRWIKNFYNQLSACSLIENASVDIVPSTNKAYNFSEILKLEINGSNGLLSRNEMLKRMSKNDINLYVTFTECAPLIPLESLELGVPCITGNNHHYFDNNIILKNYLIVDAPDNVIEIEKKIRGCLDNKELILKEYNLWKQENSRISRDSVIKFVKE